MSQKLWLVQTLKVLYRPNIEGSVMTNAYQLGVVIILVILHEMKPWNGLPVTFERGKMINFGDFWSCSGGPF